MDNHKPNELKPKSSRQHLPAPDKPQRRKRQGFFSPHSESTWFTRAPALGVASDMTALLAWSVRLQSPHWMHWAALWNLALRCFLSSDPCYMLRRLYTRGSDGEGWTSTWSGETGVRLWQDLYLKGGRRRARGGVWTPSSGTASIPVILCSDGWEKGG